MYRSEGMTEEEYQTAMDKMWSRLAEPDEDIHPDRTKYADNDGTFNIGINYVTFNGSLYYFLPDILASKLLQASLLRSGVLSSSFLKEYRKGSKSQRSMEFI